MLLGPLWVSRHAETGFTYLEVTRVTPPFAWSFRNNRVSHPTLNTVLLTFFSALPLASHDTLNIIVHYLSVLLPLPSGRNDPVWWNLLWCRSSADEQVQGGRNLLVQLVTRVQWGKGSASCNKPDWKLERASEWVSKEWTSHVGTLHAIILRGVWSMKQREVSLTLK